MNIQKTFLILSLCFISQTTTQGLSPRWRGKENNNTQERTNIHQTNSVSPGNSDFNQAADRPMTREEIIQEEIHSIRYDQKKIENLPDNNKYFIQPKSESLKELFEEIEKFNKGEQPTLPKIVILEGPPGSGKTCFTIEIAKKVGGLLYFQHASEIGGMYAGDGVIYAKMLFHNILKDSKGQQPDTEGQPVVVLIDEVDAVIPNRKNLGSGSASADMRKTMLNMLRQTDKIKEGKIMIIFTTNRLEDLDPAFKRRAKYLVTVDLPSKEELSSALNESLERHKFDKDKKPDWLVNKMETEKFSYGNIEFFLDRVRKLVNKNNRPNETESDYKEAMQITIEKKQKIESISKEEKRRNAEWEERNFQEGKKECLEALKLNPDADLKKIIKQREDKGLESSRLPPWEEENGAMLRCDSLFLVS